MPFIKFGSLVQAFSNIRKDLGKQISLARKKITYFESTCTLFYNP